jgi:hypothetical protein
VEQHYAGRIGLPAINVVKANSFSFNNSPDGRISSFGDELKNHVANDQSDKKSGYDGFGV